VVSLSGCIPPDTFELPEAVEVRDWLNLADVLPHTAVLVTHGGQATTSAGLAHRVPLLVHPLSRDQFQVAAHVATDGSGLVVDDATSVPELRDSMRTLLEQPSYGAAAAARAAELQRLGNGRLAIRALQRLLPRA
jgi:UDP:flavonoid glycosyltransferase YjiC (YdhE family)